MISKNTLILLLFISNISIADSYLENSNLSKFTSELDFLIKRVDDIEQEAKSIVKTKFHYSALRRDLILMKKGINDHINKTLSSSKIIEPLSAHYGKNK